MYVCDLVSSNTSFNKEELNAILKFGAEELFKETEEDDELQVGFTSKMSPSPFICSKKQYQLKKQLNLFLISFSSFFYIVSHLTSVIFSWLTHIIAMPLSVISFMGTGICLFEFSFSYFFLAMCARLSRSCSAFESTLNSCIISYRTTELHHNVQMIDVVVSLTSMTFCEWPSSVTWRN